MIHPLVSIIIPVYNGSTYMREAIESALGQSYDNIEVIVINDGSNDDGRTEEIALSYGDRIRYFCKDNGGVSSALNLGIQNMRGDYFSWLSHDDVYAPKKIEEQVQSLMGRERCLSLCATQTIDKDSNAISIAKATNTDVFLASDDALMYVTKHGINGCALLIPRSVFDDVGMFNEDLRYCQDVLMWWSIFLADYSLVFSDYVGVSYRVHANQVTQTRRDLFKHDAEIIAKMVIPAFVKVSSTKCNILFEYALGEAKQGNSAIVSNCLSAAKDIKLFSFSQQAILRFVEKYGLIRPYIRKAYYRLFRRITVG